MLRKMVFMLVLLTLASFLGCAALLEPPADIQRSVDYLRQDIQKLQKEQESLARKIDELSEKQVGKAFEAPAEVPAQPQKLSIEDSGNLSQDPGQLYNTGMEYMKAGKREEAEKAFADFILKFPQSDLADNAQYWIGECFYSQKKFQEAKEGFNAVVEHFPFGNKVPDALYKEALCAGELGGKEERKTLLKQLVENYPYSEAAGKAEELLSQIDKSSSR